MCAVRCDVSEFAAMVVVLLAVNPARCFGLCCLYTIYTTYNYDIVIIISLLSCCRLLLLCFRACCELRVRRRAPAVSSAAARLSSSSGVAFSLLSFSASFTY